MTWNDVVVISAILVFLGRLADWGLRKARKEKILVNLTNAEKRIKSLPFKHWEILIAGKVISAYDYLWGLATGARESWIFNGYFRPVFSLLLIGAVTAVIVETNNLNSFGASAPYMVCAMCGILCSLLSRLSNRLSTFLAVFF